MNYSVEQVFQELKLLNETTRIEAKRGSGIGDSVLQTVCAFANEPHLGGGFLLLGVCEPDEEHEDYWVEGVEKVDKLLNDLQAQCRQRFDEAVVIEGQQGVLEGRTVVAVFVQELDASAKPCRFNGKFDKKVKGKTGVWRRGLNGDYECTEQELEPLLLAKMGKGFEETVLADAGWEDLDPQAIDLYRRLRAKVRPHAEELLLDDQEMLRAMNLVEKQNERYIPKLAGVVLFGKPLAIRRLLPCHRVDYVRINGTEWVQDPEERFSTSLDFREPGIRLIQKLESAILDEMPRHFRLQEGDTQRSDEPLLPHKVIREAVVNAVMHRDYRENQPSMIIRYSNRLEIRNAGYSLKPEHELGERGSVLRNKNIASVLYDLEFAETKGTGIGTMRRLLGEVGLSAPVFHSNREGNYFTATYLLHQLMSESHLQWLKRFSAFDLDDDEAKVLVLVSETGAVDNAAVRAITGLDTLASSQLLGRLWKQKGLLVKGGRGTATYYQLSGNLADFAPNGSDLVPNGSDLVSNGSDLVPNGSDLDKESLPDELRKEISSLSPKARKDRVRVLILRVCEKGQFSSEQLASILNREIGALKTKHLVPLRKQGYLTYSIPEVVNHPQQAYTITPKGIRWLSNQMKSFQ